MTVFSFDASSNVGLTVVRARGNGPHRLVARMALPVISEDPKCVIQQAPATVKSYKMSWRRAKRKMAAYVNAIGGQVFLEESKQ